MCHLEHQRKHQWSQQRSNPIRTVQVVECFAERILKTERNDDVYADIEKPEAYTSYKLRRQQNREQMGPGRHNARTRHNRQSAHQNVFRANPANHHPSNGYAHHETRRPRRERPACDSQSNAGMLCQDRQRWPRQNAYNTGTNIGQEKRIEEQASLALAGAVIH